MDDFCEPPPLLESPDYSIAQSHVFTASDLGLHSILDDIPNTADQDSYSAWVVMASARLLDVPSTTHPCLSYTNDTNSPLHILSIETTPIPGKFFNPSNTAYTLYEPFGGTGAGLHMMLQAGFAIHQYFYSDTCQIASKVIRDRVVFLSNLFPTLLPPSATADMFKLPQDVRQFVRNDFAKATSLHTHQWIIIAGWECKDLSPAGNGEGLKGARSSSFFPLLNIVGWLQLAQKKRPPAYILENVCLAHNHKHPLVSMVLG
jgi:hypothetical protein